MVTWNKRTGGSSSWSDRNNTFSTSAIWTTATRPGDPFNGQTGQNTDHPGLERYDAIRLGWVIIDGDWEVATRPTTTDILPGSKGYNTDTGYGLEVWTGTEWTLI